MQKYNAFTSKNITGLVRELITPAFVRSGTNLGLPKEEMKAIKCNAVWDTGATNTVIDEKLAEQLKLKPVTKIPARGVNGDFITNVYWIDILLPNKVEVLSIKVTEGKLRDETSLLIGMNIITLGDFSVTNADGKTCFSFRTPSCKEIDYVSEWEKRNEKVKAAEDKATIKAKRKQERKAKKKNLNRRKKK